MERDDDDDRLDATGQETLPLSLVIPAYAAHVIRQTIEADLSIATRVDLDSRFVMSPRFFRCLYTRHLGSRLFNRILNLILGLGAQDSQAGFKGLQRCAARAIFRRQTLEAFAFAVVVLFLARGLGLKVREVAVTYRYDSEPTTVAFLRDSLNALADVWRSRRRDRSGGYAYESAPFRAP